MSMLIQLLFTLTIAGSTIVACLFVLRLLLPNANSTKWHYRIGKMAIAFYLLPIAFLFQWISSLFTLNEITTITSIREWNSSVPYVSQLQSMPHNISTDITILLIVIWGIGFVTFAAWQIYCYFKYLKELKYTYSPVSEYTEVAKQLVWIKGILGIKKDVHLAYSAAVRSPILIGLRKPTIYLPKENSPDVDMCMVLRHELIHLKRKDLWIKAFVLFTNALHWFNPLVYVLRKDIHLWSEISCDEEVVKDMSYTDRKRYGKTILSVMTGSRGLPVRFCSSLSGDGKKLKRRLNMMLNVKKLKKRTIIIPVITMLVGGIIGTSTAIYVNASVVSEKNEKALVEVSSNEAQEAEGGYYELVSVKLSDESKFSKEDWKEILEQIENNEVILEKE